MSILPDELWRRVLELGIVASSLNYKDICCVSITCRRLNRLSNEIPIWSSLLSSDFPQTHHHNHQPPSSLAAKAVYKFRFERDKTQKALAHRRAVLKIESQIREHIRNLEEIKLQLEDESKKMNATLAELLNLRKVRQASTALNVWQPEVVRDRQKQIVQNCSVPVEYRISALEMELKLCKQQIAGFEKADRDEKRRLDAAKEQLSSVAYHPLQNYKPTSSSMDDCGVGRKKFKN